MAAPFIAPANGVITACGIGGPAGAGLIVQVNDSALLALTNAPSLNGGMIHVARGDRVILKGGDYHTMSFYPYKQYSGDQPGSSPQ